MQTLFGFFERFGTVVLFIILEIVCINLLISNNSDKKSTFDHSARLITGSFQKKISRFTDIFDLDEKNRKLLIENAKLRKRIIYYEGYGESPKIDSSAFAFNVVPCKIVSQSVNRRNNYITLDKGTSDGMRPDMGVVDYNGVIGIVESVSSDYSRVISILNGRTRISAKIKDKDYIGTITWDGSDVRYVTMSDVPKHAKLSIGDEIVTSGYSTIFPENLSIGTIQSFQQISGESYYSITVALSIDPIKLKYVYAIDNLIEEQEREFISKTIAEDE